MSTKTSNSKKSQPVAEDGLNALLTVSEEKVAKGTSTKETFIIADKKIAAAMSLHAKAKALLAEGKAMKDEADGIIKPWCMEKWAAEFERTGARPESNIISNGNNDEDLLFIAMGKYKQIKDVDEFNRLRETYGEEITEKKVEFTLNPALVQKYGAVLANFIKNSKDIDEKDKAKLIQSKTVLSVAKDAIGSLKKFAAKAKTSILAVAEDLMVQKQLKGRSEEE